MELYFVLIDFGRIKSKLLPGCDSSCCCFFRASFRMWFSRSCVTQTAMRNCGRRIHTSTSAWSLVSRVGRYLWSERNPVHQWWLTSYPISSVSFRRVRGLHLSDNSSPDTPLHCLQQEERGEFKFCAFILETQQSISWFSAWVADANQSPIPKVCLMSTMAQTVSDSCHAC